MSEIFLNGTNTIFGFFLGFESLGLSLFNCESKASRAIMASSEENLDFKKLLYWKQSSVANPARVGGCYRA